MGFAQHIPTYEIGCLNRDKFTILGDKIIPRYLSNFESSDPPAPPTWVPLLGGGFKTWLRYCGHYVDQGLPTSTFEPMTIGLRVQAFARQTALCQKYQASNLVPSPDFQRRTHISAQFEVTASDSKGSFTGAPQKVPMWPCNGQNGSSSPPFPHS